MAKDLASTGRKPWILLISAPSGAGKTTLCQSLLQSDNRFRRLITCTTRPPRTGESDGDDYHFLNREAFEQQVAQGEFMEHAVVYDHVYGSRKKDVMSLIHQGYHPLLNIDVQGAASIREQNLPEQLGVDLITVFLCPPSLEELERRLRGRQSDQAEVIARRLNSARDEILHWKAFDYFIESSTRSHDLERLEQIVSAESLRCHRLSSPSVLS